MGRDTVRRSIEKGIESRKRLRQAVILAGGRGSRLGALTALRPKPMVRVHGRPFLEYQLAELALSGIQRVLILVGYSGTAIRNFFGSQACGLRIDYDWLPVECPTGDRLLSVRDQLDPFFLLCYCDNIWPLQLDQMWEQYKHSPYDAQLTIYENTDDWTNNNVALNEDRVEKYDSSRTAADLGGVEIGYAIVDRALIADPYCRSGMSFQRSAFPMLAEEEQLGAFRTSHRYYSIGNPDRLAHVERYLGDQPTIILDRDGVLNRKMPKAEYVCSWDDWQWLPGALDALRFFNRAGWRCLIVSNQAGVARGKLTESQLNHIHDRMNDEIEEAGGSIEAIYVCPHDWDEGCDCRKPNPGMLLNAQRDFALNLSKTLYVGDDERDEVAALGAGCPFRYVDEQTSLLDVALDLTDDNLNPLGIRQSSNNFDSHLEHSSIPPQSMRPR